MLVENAETSAILAVGGLRRTLSVLCVAGLSSSSTVLAGEPDLELGEYLAADCTSCHRADAVNVGIPSIFGMPETVFVRRMTMYRDGQRDNAIMRNVAVSLSEEDLAALAAYLQQAKPGK